MPRPLSNDLRERIVAAYQAGGLTYDDVAERFQVGPATVNRLLRRVRETGSVAPRTGSRLGPPPLIGPEQRAWIVAMLEDTPDITGDDIVFRLLEERQFKVGRTTVFRVISECGYTRKKKPSARKKATPSASRSSASGSEPDKRPR